MTPDQRVEHALFRCPDCGTGLVGGWVQRTREVIDLAPVPAQVTEHVYIARTCAQCRRRVCSHRATARVVMGQQRLGINLVSLIAALREEARLPWRTIQWYLDTVHDLHLSLGAIVAATQRVAQKAQSVMTNIVERIRGSPVVPRRRDRLAGRRAQRLRVDLQYPRRTLLPAAGSRQGRGG